MRYKLCGQNQKNSNLHRHLSRFVSPFVDDYRTKPERSHAPFQAPRLTWRSRRNSGDCYAGRPFPKQLPNNDYELGFRLNKMEYLFMEECHMQSRRLTDFQPKLCPCIECPLLMMALIIRFCSKKFISTSI